MSQSTRSCAMVGSLGESFGRRERTSATIGLTPYLKLSIPTFSSWPLRTRPEFTGLRLMDVWRYFRHTWTNQYTSVPGRTMVFLVRDRASENHPVIGIG